MEYKYFKKIIAADFIQNMSGVRDVGAKIMCKIVN